MGEWYSAGHYCDTDGVEPNTLSPDLWRHTCSSGWGGGEGRMAGSCWLEGAGASLSTGQGCGLGSSELTSCHGALSFPEP